MHASRGLRDEPVRVQIPADIRAPERVLYGLTLRQVAGMVLTGATLWIVVQATLPVLPAPVVLAMALPVAAGAVTVMLGQRDGISLDRWLLAALRAAGAPRRLVPLPAPSVPAAPWWAPKPRPGGPGGGLLGPLRLPLQAVGEDGIVAMRDGGAVAMTAVGTVNVHLRTVPEQLALLGVMSRWLQSLSGPVQVVVSTRRADVHALADEVEAGIAALPDAVLAGAARGYATFLRDLGAVRDPLHRQVVTVHTGSAGPLVRQQAAQTAQMLQGLEAATRLLDGPQVRDVIVDACHPWGLLPPAPVAGPQESR